MGWFLELWQGHSIAHAVLVLGVIASGGLALGSVQVRGVRLGIAGVLFAGLLAGHLGVTIEPGLREFLREFGLILFVYAIGLQVGPGLLASFRRDGVLLNGLAIAVVGLGLLTVLAAVRWCGLDAAAAVGIFSGATTNTPSLAAAQQVLKETASAPEVITRVGLGYAVAYPFGIVGIVLVMVLLKAVFRADPAAEADAAALSQRRACPALNRLTLEVTNPNLEGMALGMVPALSGSGVVVSRLLQEGAVQVARPASQIHVGDLLLAVGPPDQLEQARVVVGRPSPVDLTTVPSPLTVRRMLVTRMAVVGKTVDELALPVRQDISITRIERSGVEFTPAAGARLQPGDTVVAVGHPDALDRAARTLGNAPAQLQHPQMVPLFLGVSLGVLVGSWPWSVPGLPVPLKLGLAGGPLLAAIMLSRVGRIGPLVWYLPPSAAMLLRELGMAVFLACVGLTAGGQLGGILTGADGLRWVMAGAAVTLMPLLVVGWVARARFGVNFSILCGLLAGGMTDPPALAFANALARSDRPSVSYATVYPAVMLLRVVVAQALAALLVR